jgi:hypothetical protein
MTPAISPIEHAHELLVGNLLEAPTPPYGGVVSAVAIGFPPQVQTNQESLIVFIDTAASDCEEAAIKNEIPPLVTGFNLAVIRTGDFEGLQAHAGDSIAPVDPPRYNIPQIAAGTLGLVAKTANNSQFLVSSNHVLANNKRTLAATNVRDPGLYDATGNGGDAIAASADCVLLTAPPWPLRARTADRNPADCAWAKLNADINPLPPGVTPPAAPVTCGTPVSKFGRTTGSTPSNIRFRRWCGFIDFTFGTFYFAGQLATYDLAGGDPFAQPGDSGSLALVSNTHTGVGLVSARGYQYDSAGNFLGYIIVISPLEDVLQQIESNLGAVQIFT